MKGVADRVEAALDDAERVLRTVGRLDGPELEGAGARFYRRLLLRIVRSQTEPLRASTQALISALRAERLARLDLDAETSAARAHGAGPARVLDTVVASADPAASRLAIAAFIQGEAKGNRGTGPNGQPVTSVTCDIGDLLISARDEAILHHLREFGTWEPSEGAAIVEVVRDGMVAVDIGAHVGYRTLQLAHLVGPAGRVIAVEAAPTNFRLLAANIQHHRVENVLLVPAAAGNEAGQVDLAISETNTGDNRLFSRDGEATVRVEMVRLDDLVPVDIDVDFVKCDVQGYDQRALRGFEATLRRCRPVVIVEFCPRDIRDVGDDPEEVLDFYRSMGYQLEVIDAPTGHATETNAELIAMSEAAEHAYVNLMFVPTPRDD